MRGELVTIGTYHLTVEQLEMLANSSTSERVVDLVKKELKKRKVPPLSTAQQILEFIVNIPLWKQSKLTIQLSDLGIKAVYEIKRIE